LFVCCFWSLVPTGIASAQCDADPAWFPHANTPAPDFGPPADTSCAFHKWAWQEFLFLTKTPPGGRPAFLDLPTADDLFTLNSTPQALEELPKNRVLVLKPRSGKSRGPTEFGAILQAQTNGILIDQAGHSVYYQSQVNEAYYQFIRGNNLYIPEVFKAKATGLSFAKGCVEIKSSWWIVPPGLNVDDFFTTQARIHPLKCKSGSATCQGDDIIVDLDRSSPVTVALVGLHVVGVVEGHPEFVWATFEHKKNAPDLPPGMDSHSPNPVGNQDMTFYKAGVSAASCNFPNAGKVILDQANQVLTVAGDPNRGTNVFRAFAWGGDPNSTDALNIQALNKDVQQKLSAEGSVWQNYDLRGTTWLPLPNPPGPTITPGILGNALKNKAVGSISVANSTMETFAQGTRLNCFQCHDTAAKLSATNHTLLLPKSNLNLSHILTNGLIQRLQAEPLQFASTPVAKAITASTVRKTSSLVTPINSYDDVKKVITNFILDNGITLNSQHGFFWNSMKYDDFINGEVPGITDGCGNPIHLQILVKGKPDESNIIRALRGTPPLFSSTGSIGQMPAGTAITMSKDQIDALAKWIENGCPQ
jgi:hypothetical protein